MRAYVTVCFFALAIISQCSAACVVGTAHFADQHDGDKKTVAVTADGMVTITPYDNSQSWVVKSILDEKTCSAVIDFNVPGKPSPPPINLTATSYILENPVSDDKVAIVFTDPTGTLAAPTYPLNTWIEI
jgi:hypothetical protein